MRMHLGTNAHARMGGRFACASVAISAMHTHRLLMLVWLVSHGVGDRHDHGRGQSRTRERVWPCAKRIGLPAVHQTADHESRVHGIGLVEPAFRYHRFQLLAPHEMHQYVMWLRVAPQHPLAGSLHFSRSRRRTDSQIQLMQSTCSGRRVVIDIGCQSAIMALVFSMP